jgi:hypothetical protein
MNHPDIIILPADTSQETVAHIQEVIRLSGIGRISNCLVVVDQRYPEFKKSDVDFLLKPTRDDSDPTQEEPEPRIDHSYKAVKERNKFFR